MSNELISFFLIIKLKLTFPYSPCSWHFSSLFENNDAKEKLKNHILIGLPACD
jgi:hypothetical protein